MAKISVVIDTYNKEKDLPRCLESVKNFADEILICDEGSTDKTVQIAKKYKAKVITHERVPYVELIRNFEVSHATGDWILILDPDEELSKGLAKEILRIIKNPKADYYRIPRKNIIFGKWMKHSRWWPDFNIRLFKKGMVSWSEVIHAVPMTQGTGFDIEDKEEYAIIHHHYENLEQYVERMNRYTTQQALLRAKDGYKFTWRDLLIRPIDEFFSRYFFGQGYKDGLHGLALSLLQGFSELVLYLKIWQNDKFNEQHPKIDELALVLSKKKRDLRYWISDAKYKESGKFIDRIKRKLKI